MKNIPKILITPGEPSGIGFDILLEVFKYKYQAKIVSITNIELLKERARILKKKINIVEVDLNENNLPLSNAKNIYVHNVKNKRKVNIGKPNIFHVPLILKSLNIAIDSCLNNKADAMVTGPVQKNIIMEYGEKFSGHTEYIANRTGGTPIMMLHTKNLKIALLTTHIPLSKVSRLVSKKRIKNYIQIIDKNLQEKFGIKDPKISICGLNPHAGENGYIGNEEKNIILPIIKDMQNKGYNVHGPYSADTIFTKKNTGLILAMYHDQALPVIKTLGFGKIVNTTLGLPIIRTSVDHGTALDIAGTGKADEESLKNAIKTSISIINKKNVKKYYTK